jgi:catechol 2,3-dioxygenase-like lactoylglutathione lyase family enzyme
MNTPNLERLTAFYRDVIGFEVVSEAAWRNNASVDEMLGVDESKGRIAMLRAGNCYLEIFQFEGPPARVADPLRPNDRGYTHLCLNVTDIEAEHYRLTCAGVPFTGKPKDFGKYIAAYGKDPDGNVLELVEVRPGEAIELPPLIRQ